jgi:hypothetical protein
MKRIKFTGHFRDLIPMGLRFQKLYANNYRCYHNLPTYEPNEKRDPDEIRIFIWQKNRSFEISDWHDMEVPIIEYLQAHPFTPYQSKSKFVGMVSWVTLLCNRVTCEVKEKKPGDDPFNFYLRAQQGEITKREAERLHLEHCKTWNEITVEPHRVFELLKKFKGQYQIVEDA